MTSKATQCENQTLYQPTPRDMILLEKPLGIKVSPGGGRVAIIVCTVNWKDNRYEDICHVHDLQTGATHLVNRTGSVTQAEWVDDQTLALLKKESGDDKAQVWLYEGLVGEGWEVTDHKTGIEWFKPFAGGLLFRARHPERDENKPRADRFGKFTHLEREDSTAALYYVGLEELRQYQAQVKAATEEEAKKLARPVIELSRLLKEPLSIQGVVPSPTGNAIYLNCRKRDDLVYWRETSTYCIRLDAQSALTEHLQRERCAHAHVGLAESADRKDKEDEPVREDESEKNQDVSYLGEIVRLSLPRGASVIDVSPDGCNLLVGYQGRDDKMYTCRDLWVIDQQAALQAPDAATALAAMCNISASLDREVMDSYWAPDGIFGVYVDGTRIRVARFQDGADQVTPLDLQGIFPWGGWHISAAGRIGLIGSAVGASPEAYFAEPSGDGVRWQVRQLSHFEQAVKGWDLGTVETIRWKSRDGVEIEGVLCKPTDFDPTRKYPLVFVVHGGPEWFSAEHLLAFEDQIYYPTVQFVNKGVLVLKPNYRGSIGRGQAFTELNVNNLGMGDLWDLESAIEYLVGLGWVDAERVGCMGWSQGGYISAFAGLHSDKFRAVSVGAGISDWYTYHISNDIPDFTVDYLSGSPFRGRDLYVKTAPISNIANARTPTLIQHGSEDRRVPFSNAMELYRGLKEMGVPVELFVFPGMGHSITRPREHHAVMYQNLAWFSHYLLGEELKLD